MRKGYVFQTKFFVVRALKGSSYPHFAIVISNKFAKSSVTKNKLKRAISVGIEKYLESDKIKNYQYVFIPKKRILNENDKIAVNVEEISTEVYSVLSEISLP